MDERYCPHCEVVLCAHVTPRPFNLWQTRSRSMDRSFTKFGLPWSRRQVIEQGIDDPLGRPDLIDRC